MPTKSSVKSTSLTNACSVNQSFLGECKEVLSCVLILVNGENRDCIWGKLPSNFLTFLMLWLYIYPLNQATSGVCFFYWRCIQQKVEGKECSWGYSFKQQIFIEHSSRTGCCAMNQRHRDTRDTVFVIKKLSVQRGRVRNSMTSVVVGWGLQRVLREHIRMVLPCSPENKT